MDPGDDPRSYSTVAPRNAHRLSFSLRDSLSEATISISDQLLNISVSEDRGRASSSVPTTPSRSSAVIDALNGPLDTEDDVALHLIARDELARLNYLESQPRSCRERRSVGITPRVDDGSTVREVPPYLHIVDGEQFIDTDNSVQDMQASFRQRKSDWLRRYLRHQTELRRSPPDIGEPTGDGLFLYLPIFNSL